MGGFDRGSGKPSPSARPEARVSAENLSEFVEAPKSPSAEVDAFGAALAGRPAILPVRLRRATPLRAECPIRRTAGVADVGRIYCVPHPFAPDIHVPTRVFRNARFDVARGRMFDRVGSA